ncbi:MAG: peptidyl-prolyl cis-trans isomerase [Pseudomonadales bacterium]|nr:peptidyl-prolyl cis-trans isomerase [Pseudomonadales bacterium]
MIRRVLREPLFQFIVAGLLLYCARIGYETYVGDAHEIVVTAARVDQLARQYALQFGHPPDDASLETLIERDAKDEILYREAKRLGLGSHDEIVRRRLIQKMKFLVQDTSAPPEPVEANLEDWYRTHASDYEVGARATFTHIYFQDERSGQRRAEQAKRAIQAGTSRAPELGDPFPDLYDFSSYDRTQVERVFGKTPLSDAVFEETPGSWSGPWRSAYGWHLLFIESRQPAHVPDYREVRKQVRADYLANESQKANDAALDALEARYTIVREDLGARP